MEQCTSNQPSGGVSQHLMDTFTRNYGSVESNSQRETSFQVDPAVLARTMQIVANQMAATQTQQQSIPRITRVTTQQTLALAEGQYIGDVQNGLPHGRGTLTYHPGSERKKYEGEWENGQFHGRGILRFSNENRYEGQWNQGKLHGQGIKFFASGAKYEGGFINGNYHGQGTIRYDDGSTYVGNWANGLQEGYGQYKWANGDSYEGMWENGNRHGQGTFKKVPNSESNGYTYIGSWENDEWHGQGRQIGGYNNVGIFKNGHLWTGKSSISTPYHTSEWTYKDGIEQKGCLDYICCCF